MTTYYQGNNMQLTFDGTSWSIGNVAQNFIDPNTFSSPDPVFPTVPETPETDTTTPETDPCPPGYIYDNTLKQCVPDPNAQNPFVQQQGGGGGGPDRPDNSVYIPPNSTKENWIENANKIIPAGQEGAGKTGLQNYIDNLDDRGWIKKEDDKIIFLKDNLGNALASAAGARIGMAGEPKAKTDKIIQDLQRMGAIDAQITASDKIDPETGEPFIDFAPEMEVSTTAFAFPTYNYEPGTELTGFRPGDYTGFTTPATHTLGKQSFKTWEDYMDTLFNVKTSVTSPQDVGAPSANIFDNAINEQKLEQEKEKTKQEKIKTDKEIDEATGKFSGDKTDKQIDRDTGKFSGSPKASTKPQAPPGQPTTGPHIGYGGGGTSLGSSVHGAGSYNPGSSSSSYQGPSNPATSAGDAWKRFGR